MNEQPKAICTAKFFEGGGINIENYHGFELNSLIATCYNLS